MSMKKENQMYVLIGLVVLLGAIFYWNRTSAGGADTVVAGNVKFEPLKVEDPQLRLDLLDKVRDTEYKGSNHNIFSYAPPAPPPTKTKIQQAQVDVGPKLPPPPPPLNVPVTFFGFSVNPKTQRRLAFLSANEDVFIVGEGGTVLSRFRLVKIGNGSADFEEISSGRHATVAMTQPEEQQ
jgi:hypothetical protein